jgi:hypothetical protein
VGLVAIDKTATQSIEGGKDPSGSDVGFGCNSKVATNTSRELSPSISRAEPQAKNHLCGNSTTNTFKEKTNKIKIRGKRCTRIYMKKQKNEKK